MMQSLSQAIGFPLALLLDIHVFQAFIKSAPVTRTTSALRTEERGMKPGTSLLELMLCFALNR
jgi:hypothetical protein